MPRNMAEDADTDGIGMTYTVKEVFKTIQGEGYHAGRAAVFVRFAGCNLWSGREQDRADAKCQFCDTDFVGGEKYKREELVGAIRGAWGEGRPGRFVVFTGGEPLLQLDGELIEAVHQHGFGVGVETNGTLPAPSGIQWLCCSPKAGVETKLSECDELKIVFPQDGLDPEVIRARMPTSRYSIQPKDGPDKEKNTEAAIAYVKDHPRWRLSLQTHKFVGIR